ncbi:hypothetical protein [Parasitella parasitica]|uniref:SEC7 domain-containing protein n=1 Tax=Parasitella parasitica TaxID=35722 RepID=A0A0B7MQH3_9FUNG|nr:hypothetical protein [Parasitella parasitica]
MQKEQHQKQQEYQHRNNINKVLPCIQPTLRQESSARNSQLGKLTRSSSLSNLSRKASSRQILWHHKRLDEPLPPIPPFLFEESEAQAVIIPPSRSSSLSRPRRFRKTQRDDEIKKALLEWKHESIFKVDWVNMFPASVELWNMNDNIFGSLEDLIILKEDDEKLVQETANSLWLENEMHAPKKKTAAYIGKLDPFCHRVLKQYMNQFDFTGMKLDEAFRKLCQKLYFKAEAQEIDRILEAFAYKFWSQNPCKQLYQNAGTVLYM